ncbi:MAG: TlpA family protein disulfide reductase [Chloroflexi bacterium]|nr:TlpA family protein disulfide reductase [Chloroflexota bacterium]
MPGWKTLALGVIALLIVAAIYQASSSSGPRLGTAAPTAAVSEDDILAKSAVQSLDGTRIPIKSFRGKWLLINIWATSCGPCRAEMPSLNEIWDTQHRAGLQMLGVSGEDPEDLWSFLNQIPPDHAIHYPIVNDPGSQIQLAMAMNEIPRTIILDPKGHVAFDQVGEEDTPMLMQALTSAGFPVR